MTSWTLSFGPVAGLRTQIFLTLTLSFPRVRLMFINYPLFAIKHSRKVKTHEACLVALAATVSKRDDMDPVDHRPDLGPLALGAGFLALPPP